MQNNQSGVFMVLVDDQEPFELDLLSQNVSCELFVDYYLANGSHNVTLELRGWSRNAVGFTQRMPGLGDGEVVRLYVRGVATSILCCRRDQYEILALRC